MVKINPKLLPYFVAVAGDKDSDGSIWTILNGSQKRFTVKFGETEKFLEITFNEYVTFVVMVDTREIVKVNFFDAENIGSDVSDIMKNIVRAESIVG